MPAAAPNTAPATDVAATKAKTRGALLDGLKSGALEAAVAKMEEDTAAEEEPAAPDQVPVCCTVCVLNYRTHWTKIVGTVSHLSLSSCALQSPTPRTQLASEVGDQLTEEVSQGAWINRHFVRQRCLFFYVRMCCGPAGTE